MCENRQSGFAIDTNSSRLQWGTVPHQDPTKSSAIANRNCRVPDAASGREPHQGCRPWLPSSLKVILCDEAWELENGPGNHLLLIDRCLKNQVRKRNKEVEAESDRLLRHR